MAKNKDRLTDIGIQFFGQMSASATHEIKNALAIINENAGLLGDLSMMPQNEHSLTPKRAHSIAQKVAKHVQRADLVLKKLNRLSHSADQVTQIEDLEEIVCFVLDLTSRLVEQQGVIIEVTSPDSPVIVNTNIFYLENAIWRAIEAACLAAEGEKKIMISFGNDVTTPSIWFSMDIIKNNSMDYLFGSKEAFVILAYLGIFMEKNIENNSFGLLWPKRS